MVQGNRRMAADRGGPHKHPLTTHACLLPFGLRRASPADQARGQEAQGRGCEHTEVGARGPVEGNGMHAALVCQADAGSSLCSRFRRGVLVLVLVAGPLARGMSVDARWPATHDVGEQSGYTPHADALNPQSKRQLESVERWRRRMSDMCVRRRPHERMSIMHRQAAAQAHGNHWSYLPSHSRPAGSLLACTQPTSHQILKPHEASALPKHRQASLRCHACTAPGAHAKHQNPNPNPSMPASGVERKHWPGGCRCKRMGASAAGLLGGLQTPSGAGRHQACDLAGTG